MSLEQRLNDTLAALLHSGIAREIKNDELIQCIDLTLLDAEAPLSAVNELKDKASTYKVAALCLYLQHYGADERDVVTATVINFPHGQDSVVHCLEQISTAVALGLDEIDYVFPYQDYLSGNTAPALKHCQEIADNCAQNTLQLKVILETGAFPNIASIYQLASELIPMGVHFLKTSTGKTTHGASLSAVFALLAAIKDAGSNTGLKVSGGVKTVGQALAYARLAELMLAKTISPDWFRIGASSLLDNLLVS